MARAKASELLVLNFASIKISEFLDDKVVAQLRTVAYKRLHIVACIKLTYTLVYTCVCALSVLGGIE